MFLVQRRYLVDLVLFNDVIEECVKVIEEVYHLYCRALRGQSSEVNHVREINCHLFEHLWLNAVTGF